MSNKIKLTKNSFYWHSKLLLKIILFNSDARTSITAYINHNVCLLRNYIRSIAFVHIYYIYIFIALLQWTMIPSYLRVKIKSGSKDTFWINILIICDTYYILYTIHTIILQKMFMVLKFSDLRFAIDRIEETYITYENSSEYIHNYNYSSL